MNSRLFKTILINTLPVMTGYLALGFGLGVLMADKGYGILWMALSSLIIYAGSMQFVLVGLLTSGAGLITTALTTLMVNARHLFYGISMIDKYKGAGKKKPYLIFALTDETYSLVCTGDTPEGVEPHKYHFLVSLFNQIYWVTGSLLGVAVGSAIPFNTEGIDFCMTALFITIFVEQWISAKNHFPAIAGLIITTVCRLIFGADAFLIPSMIAISAVMIICRKWIDKEDENV